MKRKLFVVALFLAMLVSVSGCQRSNADGQTSLTAKLRMLEPLVNRYWTGELEDSKSGEVLETYRGFEAILGGAVVRYVAAIPSTNSYAEGYMYWNRETSEVELFVVHSSGAIQDGIVRSEDDVITLQGTIRSTLDGYEYRNTFEPVSDNSVVDSWFELDTGTWNAGRVISLEATEPKEDSGLTSNGQLSEAMAVLEPLVSKHWVGALKDPTSTTMWETHRDFQVLWNGNAVSYKTSLPERDNEAVGYLYWDAQLEQIGVFLVDSSGVIQRGVVSSEAGVITLQGRIVFPDRAFDYRNTFVISDENTMVDSWFQNAFGPWRSGHIIQFRAVEPE